MFFKPIPPVMECFILSAMFTAASGLVGAKAGVIFARAATGNTFSEAMTPMAAMIGGAIISKMAANEGAPVGKRNAVVLGAALIAAPMMYLYLTGTPMTDYPAPQQQPQTELSLTMPNG